jgi:septum site-determining protein MinD
MGEAIVITSGKGGVGKTTTTANIGAALALAGQKVCLVDTDIGLRNLDCVMGLENRIIYDLIDVAEGKELEKALIKDKRFENLYLLPAAQTRDKSAITPEQTKRIVEELKNEFDYVLIDCPAGIEQGFQNAVAGADQAIVVTTPEVSAIRDADRVIGLIDQQPHIQSPRLVVNRIRRHMVKEGNMLDVDEVVSVLAIDLLGIVVDDDNLIAASNMGEPIVLDPTKKSAIAYRNISRRILGESVPLLSLEDDKTMLTKMKKFFGIR